MIKLLNVSKVFNRGRANQIQAIDQTSLQLGDTGLVTFLGNSGCGKTTLLNAIGGLDKIDKGEIWIDNQKLSGISASRKDNIRNHKIGYIFQNYNLLENESVFNNVAIVLKMLGLKDQREIEKRVDFVLDTIGIKQYKKRPAKMLSGGERQRVGIARAIVKNPDVIIADEPTGNLDSANTLEIMNIIKAISKDKLVILVTHEKPLAQFFSDRIIEIVDGKVVSDQENFNSEKLDYRIDNKLYLKDMAIQDKIETPLGCLSLYGDDIRKHNIKVVIKDNNIYIDTDGLLLGSNKVELIDDHYYQLDKATYENYVFDYKNVLDTSKLPKKSYTSIYSLCSMFRDGFSKVIHYSKLKKFLLLGFVFAAMFVTLAISSIAGTLKIEEKDFLKCSENYVQIDTGKLTPEIYENYINLPNKYYVLPGDTKITLPIRNNQIFQLSNDSLALSGSLAGVSQLPEARLIAGSMPKIPGQIVIDKSIIKNAKKNSDSLAFNLINPKDYIGKTIADRFTVVGVCDNISPSFYIDDSILIPTLLAYQNNENQESTNLKQYNFTDLNDTPILTKGRWPTNDYEVVISQDDDTELGKLIKVKGLEKSLKVVGKYHNPSKNNALLVNQTTLLYSRLNSFNKLTIAPCDKAKFIESLAGSKAKVSDTYTLSRQQFINDSKEDNKKTILTSLIMIIISLIEVYLMLRSSFLSRIKEVGVLRAIGLKKFDIYKMFFGEIFAITCFTAIPGISIISYFLYYMSSLDMISRIVVVNPMTFIVTFLILLAFNTLAGLFPAFRVLRQPPARILARIDVN